MAAKCRIIWDNRYLEAATLTASSAATGYPVANVKDKLRKRTWRTTNHNSETLTVDMGATVDCNCLALVNLIMTCTGTITIEASAAADFGTLLLDQDESACHGIIGYGEGGYGLFGYGGSIPEDLRDFYDPEPVRVIYFDTLVSARYWRITFVDPDSLTGYISLGRVFLTIYDEYQRQFGYGSEYGGLDESATTRSLGGQLWVDRMPVIRQIACYWPAFRQEDCNWTLLHFIRIVGITSYFVVDPAPDGQASDRHFLKLYCRLAEIPALTFTDNKFRELTMQFEEVV